MATKNDVTEWVISALEQLGGRGSLVDVAREIWKNHEQELRSSGDLFYTWQYDMRWSATRLRHAGTMTPANISPFGIWELAEA